MKGIIVIVIMILFYNPAIAQTNTASADFAPVTRLVGSAPVPPTEKVESVQTRFINQEWTAGTVSFKNLSEKISVPLLFDVFSNKLYFNQDNTFMEFTNPVLEFTLILKTKEETNNITFRNSYPAVDKNNDETFYEVMAEGKFQLLKCKAKSIYLIKEQNLPEEQRSYHREVYYAYTPAGKMVNIKKNKEDILKQLPEYANNIQTVLDSKKIKIKNDQSLKQLFQYLNEMK